MDILIPALVLSGIGLILGVLIYIVSTIFAVKTDENLTKLIELMPGYNCGACGFPGCSGLARAIYNGEGKPSNCKPMKKEQEERILEFLKDLKK